MGIYKWLHICVCLYVVWVSAETFSTELRWYSDPKKTVIGIEEFELSSSIVLDANWTIYDEDKNWFITKFKEHMHIQYLYLYIYIEIFVYQLLC